MSDKLVTVSLSHVKDFQFEINYGDGMPVLLADEPPPLGAGLGLHTRVLDASGRCFMSRALPVLECRLG